jgi:MFS family permease
VARGNTLFGAITVVAGICGTLAGGWLGDRCQRTSGRGYLLVSGWGFLVGAPITFLAIASPSLPVCVGAMFLAECFLFLNTGPLNTLIVNVTHPSIRTMAFAVNIFFIHALGDAISPTLLGHFSDLWGLRAALLTTPAVIVLAGILCFLCGRYVEADTARVDSPPSGEA